MKYLGTPARVRRIDLAVGLLVAILATLSAIYGVLDRQTQIRAGGDDARLLAGQTALTANGTLDAARQLLRAIAVVAQTSPAGDASEGLLRKWTAENRYIMDLLILSADGMIVSWTASGDRPRVDDRAYYRAHLGDQKSQLHIGQPLLSKVHAGKWFFAISEDFRRPDGSLQGVVVAVIDLALFKDRLAVSGNLGHRTQLLVDREGHVYTRLPDHETVVGKQIKIAELTSQGIQLVEDQPFIVASPIDGKQRIAAVKQLPNYPLIAAGSVALNEVLSPWRERLAIVVAVWLLISAGLVWVGHRLKDDLALQERLANTDSLTGIPNRRSILSTASSLEQLDRGLNSLAVLMIDVDHFKQVNDTFGHGAGDEVLRAVAITLRSQCRLTDIVGRYGGEEFLVLMPHTDLAGACSVAEKLRAAVEMLYELPTRVTVSIGVATTGTGERSLEEAIRLADQALYEAKDAGRNRIRQAA